MTNNFKLKTENKVRREKAGVISEQNTHAYCLMPHASSFTLVELLIVIGILAILTAAVVITLNPAERLRESRDSQRIQELSSLEQTINLLLTQTPNLSMGTASTVYISIPDSSATCSNLGLPTLPAGYTYACKTAANYRKTDSTGWIPINFQSGLVASLPTLPVDPTNTTSSGLYYTYMMGGSFELNGLLESKKRRVDTDDDGGDSFSILEKGSNKTLAPYKDSGLVGYWTFDEGTGTNVRDISGNNNNGTWQGTIGNQWSSGKLGQAGQFDGTSNKVSVPNSATLRPNTVTVSAWIMLRQTSGTQWIVTKDKASGVSYTLNSGYLNPNYINFCTIPITTSYCAKISNSSFLNSWNFLTGVYDGTNNYLYINGVLVNSVAGSPLDYTSPTSLFLGGYTSSAFLNGLIDEVRIYNRALSDAEIKAIYDATK